MPRVSIGLPVFNGAQYLVRTLDAILEQSYDDFELFISDNASTDTTPDICHSYAQRDWRIRYERLATNQGVVYNSNHVFHQARGEYFRWASHDDLVAPHHLARCVETLDAHPEMVAVYSQVMLIDGRGAPIDHYREPEGLDQPNVVERYRIASEGVRLCNILYGLIRADSLRATKLCCPYVGSDIDLILELLLHGPMCEIPEVLFLRRLHDQAASQMTEEALRHHYSPDHANSRSLEMKTWWRYGNRFDQLRRAPIGLAERLALISLLAKQVRWHAGEMCDELFAACGWPIPAGPPAPSPPETPATPQLENLPAPARRFDAGTPSNRCHI